MSSHLVPISPLHVAVEYLCKPAKPERVSKNTRLPGSELLCPSYIAMALTRAYALKYFAEGPSAVGVESFFRYSMLAFERISGSDASIHHASKPLVKRCSLSCSQKRSRAP